MFHKPDGPPLPPPGVAFTPQAARDLSDRAHATFKALLDRAPADRAFLPFEHVIEPQRLSGQQAAAFSSSDEQLDLVTTPLVGARMWVATPDGQLRSPSFGRQAWTPGENVAVCRRTASLSEELADKYTAELEALGGYKRSISGRTGMPLKKVVFNYPCKGLREEPSCPHGFYAYTGGPSLGGFSRNSQPGAVAGLIEGYGIVRYGTNGFICEKARIIALVAPDLRTDPSSMVERDGVFAGLREQLSRRLALGPFAGVPAVGSWTELEDEHPQIFDRLVQTAAFTMAKK